MALVCKGHLSRRLRVALRAVETVASRTAFTKMRVDFRGVEVTMAEELLHVPQTGTLRIGATRAKETRAAIAIGKTTGRYRQLTPQGTTAASRPRPGFRRPAR